MSNETPCSSSSFSSKRKEISVCFDKDNQKLQRLYRTSDIHRTVCDKSDSVEEVLSSIKQKLTSYKIEKSFENSLIIGKDDGDGNDSDDDNIKGNGSDDEECLGNGIKDEGFNNQKSKKIPLIRSNQNISTTSKKKVQCSKDSSDEEKSEELDYQWNDEEMVEVETNRISSGVWKNFKRLSSEDGNYKV
ncbi:hypothetical protein BpHYR1_047555 [Brachionus plicatilis]|uniref:Uncharacterized protein n=1 Tax=Brachionus plicatilis TaxID=10195 RepID=A0A3M7SSA9_BRAPC|nr:hypothetical protein BpHYR1_047555 [Brachionus plicatilis]